jgi:ribosomal protein S18 acetylase RimI-like enzyme
MYGGIIPSGQPVAQKVLNRARRFWMIAKAMPKDVDAMKKVADASRYELGFILRVQMQEAVEENRAFVTIINNKVVGFVIYRHRKKDLQTTLGEICISQEYRGQGLGKELIRALVQECSNQSRAYIQLKCPVGLHANKFYEHLGFRCISTQPGKSRSLNVWVLDIKKEM